MSNFDILCPNDDSTVFLKIVESFFEARPFVALRHPVFIEQWRREDKSVDS